MPPASTDCNSISDLLKRWAADFDGKFAALLESAEEAPPELVEAMRYSALAPGKRLRPYLVWRWCESAGGTAAQALPPAAAVECVHAFSLIHDDLPAMDDDDLRRGRPACHKQFGEAMAILAGDALLALAFEIIARHTPDPARASAMIGELACGAGWAGMIGGQAADVIGEVQPATRDRAEYVHRRKTARLFEAACKLGALAAGGDAVWVQAAGRYGRSLGSAFQIADDLLDVTATAEQMGKGIGKDSGAGKQTFPAAVGIEASRQAAGEAAEQAIASLDALPDAPDDLAVLARFVVDRQH